MNNNSGSSFSPREIVSELDRFIIGQVDAKRAVAVALRNRWRRQQLSDDLREEVLPKNILMIGVLILFLKHQVQLRHMMLYLILFVLQVK